MKKFYFVLAMVAVAVTSCQKDVVYNDIPSQNTTIEESVSSYAISEEEAIKRLEAELTVLYGEDTRACQRKISKIEPVRFDNVSMTRSSDIENLLYIVEFEDGEGSAIIGADERVEDVFAVLEEGVITVEDFNNAANGVNYDNLPTYLAGLIAEEAIEQVQTSSVIVLPPVSDLAYSYFEYENVLSESSECLLKSKWGQGYPYNMMCYNDEGQVCYAGCVTICAAQVLLYNPVQTIYDIIIDGESFNRSLLNLKGSELESSMHMSQMINNEVARYVAKLADVLDIRLGVSSSSGYLSDIAPLMTSMGYANVDYIPANDLTFDGAVRDQLYVRRLPAPFRGSDVIANVGHAWVIDGFKHQKDREYLVTKEGGVIISREYCGIRTIQKVHCNYGWNGVCDGYYSYGIFDVSQTLPNSNIVTDVGDLPGSAGYSFSSSNAMISYELPN